MKFFSDWVIGSVEAARVVSLLDCAGRGVGALGRGLSASGGMNGVEGFRLNAGAVQSLVAFDLKRL